jgi:hypothetical protein
LRPVDPRCRALLGRGECKFEDERDDGAGHVNYESFIGEGL